MQASIKLIGRIFPPSFPPLKLEYEKTWGVEEVEEKLHLPRLTRFNPKADLITNFRKVILRKEEVSV